MREILFRGKQKDNGEWVYGAYSHHNSLNRGFIVNVGVDNISPIAWTCEIIPETIGQYTGLTDKNGTKIFEGDIVKEVDIKHKGETQIKGKVYEVKMRKGCWTVQNHKGKYDYEKWDFLNTFAPTVEVIGNTHDNPELAKEREG